ncbi:MAG TPA: competence protein ComA [Ruminococcaceae bacterium]|nr:competence protein ComA [Oscillospiraceae bacterium]
MLSLDFTDRQVKIVRGSLMGSKIRIIQVETLNLPLGLIENGFVADVPMLAGELLEFLQTKDIKEKDIIAEIGSGLILHKELILPKPKSLKNSNVIETMIKSNMNISNDYNISYNIVGEAEDENKNPMVRVLATAVPQRLVDGYTRLFSHLGLSLKSLFVSSGCISRLVENSQKLLALSPLMMVQVEYDFIATNLYSDGRLVLSRRVAIDAEEIGGDSDALVQAVYDNVFRMIQFMNSRPDSKPLKEITFYGKIPDFVMLSNSMASFNTSTHVLSSPGNVVAFCEFDFAEYANAISAFFKAKSDFDRIDLLKSSAAKEKKPASYYGLILAGSILASCAVVAGVFFVFNSTNNRLKAQIASEENEITQYKAREEVLNGKIARLDSINMYSNNVQMAKYLFDFQPTIVTDILKKLEEPLTDGMGIVGTVSISGYNVTVNYECKSDSQPVEYVRALKEQGYFENISYHGYTGQGTGDNMKYNFSLSMLIKGGNTYEAEQ